MATTCPDLGSYAAALVVVVRVEPMSSVVHSHGSKFYHAEQMKRLGHDEDLASLVDRGSLGDVCDCRRIAGPVSPPQSP
jgi:hypothetical protein